MVLNTSFNRKKEPIVESPDDALRALQGCQGDITALFIGTVVSITTTISLVYNHRSITLIVIYPSITLTLV